MGCGCRQKKKEPRPQLSTNCRRCGNSLLEAVKDQVASFYKLNATQVVVNVTCEKCSTVNKIAVKTSK